MGDILAFHTLYGLLLKPVKVVVRISLINGIVKPPGRCSGRGLFPFLRRAAGIFSIAKYYFFILNLFPEAPKRASLLLRGA
jgi:hypothetical protein